jgi:nucleoside-diphosphate-sugar epimerase
LGQTQFWWRRIAPQSESWDHSDLIQGLAALNPRVVVTGASGWLGTVASDALRTAGVTTQEYARRARGRFLALDEIGAAPEGDGPLLLLHFAFLTQDKLATLGHDEYVAANAEITRRMLDWIEREKPDAIFVASSGAAARDKPIEQDPYGAMKRLDEAAFAQAAESIDARLRIARVYNVAGRHITTPELYALGDLVGSTLRGEPLRIKAGGDVVRSYIAADDLIAVVLADLLAPGRPQKLTFDTAGETVEISELADAVRSALGRDDLPIERNRDAEAPPSVYVGDGSTIAELLELHGIRPTPLAEQIRQTAESIQ